MNARNISSDLRNQQLRNEAKPHSEQQVARDTSVNWVYDSARDAVTSQTDGPCGRCRRARIWLDETGGQVAWVFIYYIFLHKHFLINNNIKLQLLKTSHNITPIIWTFALQQKWFCARPPPPIPLQEDFVTHSSVHYSVDTQVRTFHTTDV